MMPAPAFEAGVGRTLAAMPIFLSWVCVDFASVFGVARWTEEVAHQEAR